MRITLSCPWTGEEIAHAAGGYPPAVSGRASCLTTDSREVEPGDLFVALRGEAGDGHHYIPDAIARGAALVLCERCLTPPPSAILVGNTDAALAAFARAALDRIAPTVIAVTGSVGKTTTKNMLAAVLSEHFRTHKSPGNFNNLLGASLTLLSMPQNTEMLVAELGMNHAGELSELSALVRPDIAVITNVGTAHIGNLGSREAIAAAKLEVLSAAGDGVLYLYPHGEPLLKPPARPATVPLTVGDGAEADCFFENLRPRGDRSEADIICRGRPYYALSLPGAGRHIATAACFAVGVGVTLGLREKELRHGLSACPREELRGQILSRGGVRIIMDCYNASPEAMRAACALLTEGRRGGRRIALLGDMCELGAHSAALHRAVGEHFARAGTDLLFTLGREAEEYASGALAAGMPAGAIFRFPDPDDPAPVAAALAATLKRGDTLLVKASRALSLERVTALLPEEFEI